MTKRRFVCGMGSCLLLCVGLFLLGGCAFGVTPVPVGHSALEPVVVKRTGTVVIRPFIDHREQPDHEHIGTKRNGYGMPVGRLAAADTRPVNVLVTELFGDALRQAGYQVVDGGQPAAATMPKAALVVDGEIKEFWTDMYMKVWHRVTVRIKLLDQGGQRVVWEKEIEGSVDNVLWWGATGEFQGTIQQAVDLALNRAAKEFASDEFYGKVKAGS